LLVVEIQQKNLRELVKYGVSLIFNYHFIAFHTETIDKNIIAKAHDNDDDDDDDEDDD
jgi:hypothetical protein